MTIEPRALEVYDRSMAATAPTLAPPAPAPFRFTRKTYYRLGELGLFDGMRVELLDGEIIRMSPQSVPHAGTITALTERLVATLAGAYTVRVQLPIVLADDSEPEPDFAVCDARPEGYFAEHPLAAQVRLIIEVAFSSVEYDRGRKGAAYARAGIPAYWLANLPDRIVEVYSEPNPGTGRYLQTNMKRAGDHLKLPGGAVIEVEELLPPAPRSPQP